MSFRIFLGAVIWVCGTVGGMGAAEEPKQSPQEKATQAQVEKPKQDKAEKPPHEQEPEEKVGKRPYEMDWAGRTKDTRPPLVDFENLDNWAVHVRDAAASWRRSREQQIWDHYVGKLVYRGTGQRPTITIRPPKPVSFTPPVDCVNLWVYGNNWGWAPDPTTPPVGIDVLLVTPTGVEHAVHLGVVRWKEWFLMHARMTPELVEAFGQGGAFSGIRITGARNKEDRTLYFDNLAIYKEVLRPLVFEPRPKRGVEPLPGQSVGTNTGPGKLPFPTREETILPDNLTAQFQTTLQEEGGQFVFRYEGADGQLVYRYRPATGTLGDITAEWVGRGGAFRPMEGGGLLLIGPDKPTPTPPEPLKLLRCQRQGNEVESVWQCPWQGQPIELAYTLRLWQKSLVVDVRCLGGHVGEVRFGAAAGVQNPRLVTLPYLTGDSHHRPAVLVLGPPEKPLFLMGLVDHCRSNASELFFLNEVKGDRAVYNGGARYLPRTDGRRNDCFERLFLTISPRFEEVLPNVPNPKSPWMHVAGERVWRAHGASNRQQDYALWKRVARYGMSKILITDHETGWRDGGESFTFRTRAAPGKGGDEGQADYARKVRALGFRYGIYNNYTDYAPVNEHWDEDCVTRLPDGSWRTAWPRCYNPKPARAVEFEARLAPIIQKKFQLDTGYCDVHTAVRPWHYVDYDARVPGAGTFAATFYAYGEIMLHQKATWNGPVYSEGNNHWYYCGLTDGNYGQDQAARLDENPWLVDFDLRKLHPLCCNFGMGNLGMFFGRGEGLGDTPEERDRRLDRFLAATLAFGHTGFLVLEGGIPTAARSYFALQQIHAAYAQQTAVDIRYADQSGRLLPSTEAVATGAFRRNQIVTTYSNGLKVWVNGHPTETWKTSEVELPPNGWFVQDPSGKLAAFSACRNGHRVDYVDSPEYLYADGRGRLTRFDKAVTDGQAAAIKRPDGRLELIPIQKCTVLGVWLGGGSGEAIGLNEEGRELGPTPTRFSRGLVHIAPEALQEAADKKVFSYLLRPTPKPQLAIQSDRTEVVPGETVRIVGKTEHTYQVPADAKPGQVLWIERDGAWIDFRVVALVDAAMELQGQQVRVRLRPNLAGPTEATPGWPIQRTLVPPCGSNPESPSDAQGNGGNSFPYPRAYPTGRPGTPTSGGSERLEVSAQLVFENPTVHPAGRLYAPRISERPMHERQTGRTHCSTKWGLGPFPANRLRRCVSAGPFHAPAV